MIAEGNSVLDVELIATVLISVEHTKKRFSVNDLSFSTSVFCMTLVSDLWQNGSEGKSYKLRHNKIV